jgi:galactokinase
VVVHVIVDVNGFFILVAASLRSGTKSMTDSISSLLCGLRTSFAEKFSPYATPKLALAPGRVNLIGEHTDYNDGYVLPMAIDRYVTVAFAPRTDRTVKVHSADFGETREWRDSPPVPRFSQRPGPSSPVTWFDYIAGVFWALQEAGFETSGVNLAVKGNVPIGAGLSSSAALEMAVARAICESSDISWNGAQMARIGQKVENCYIGVNSGIMDQFAAAVSSHNCALLLDCRSLQCQTVPIPCNAAVIVMDTGIRRTLSGSAYNERHASCMRAVEVIRHARSEVKSLRDVDLQLLEQNEDALDAVTFRRARHVVVENYRPVEMAEALRVGNLAKAGELMRASHDSLRDLYEVSCAELDLISEIASGHPACYGARMTGAGFGGCAVALVDKATVQQFVDDVGKAYRSKINAPSALYECSAAEGARIVE